MPRTEKPPGVADALTLWTLTCGAENHHLVGVMPQQLDGRERLDLDVEHLTGAGQLVTQVLGGDPGQHQLGHHQHRHHQRAEAERG